MKVDAAALPTGVRSGWVPAVLAFVVVAVALLTHDVSFGELARYTAYAVLGLVLPGIVLWRLLVPRPGSTLIADAVFGTSLALAVELPVYAFFAHFDLAGVAKAWPVVPLALLLVPDLRRRVWRPATPQPLWWSWGMGALTALAVLVLNQVAWAVAPLTPAGLRNPYVDIPYQLSLVSGLSRHVRSDLPFVDGEPLYYHWFDHAHLAAAQHATGVEAVVLLSRLDMVLVAGIVILGSAMIAQRVSRSALAGLVATAVLTVGGTALIWPHFSTIFLNTSNYISPTTAFACAILVGCIAVSIELLDPDERPPATAWVAAALLIVASSGAKGPALPLLLAGWISLLLMGLILRRRVVWSALALTVLGVVVFFVAQKVIYGGSEQGTAVLPFGLANYIATDYGLLDHPTGGSIGLRAAVGGAYVVIRLSCLVALAGLFTPGTWRNPHAHFLVGSIVGGAAAMSLLDSATRNQVYFLLVTPVFVAAATGWGLVELLRRVSRPMALRICLGFLVGGAVLSAVLLRLRPPGFDGKGDMSLGWFLAQTLLVILVIVVVAVVLTLMARRRPSLRHAAPLACASLALGLGMLTGPLHALDITAYARPAEVPSTAPEPAIAPGGITAARWLRDHSDPDAIVATNSHCRFPAPQRCDHRAFWISAYSERQMLLEGWSYTSRSAAEAAKQGKSVPFMSFWDHELLMENERAFWQPTRARLDRLKKVHHVSWLFVDKRFRADLRGLRRHADQRLNTKNYAVFELR